MLWVIPFTCHIGGFIRWLFKGCQTNLGDEVHGRLESKTFLKDYDLENYIIGITATVIILGLAIWMFF